jgi:putative endonuclease
VLFTRWTDGIGELDLIAWYQGRIVFVEVKARRASEKKSGFYPATISTLMDDALAAVDEEKKRRVTRASLRFLKRHRLLGYPCRFDIVAVAALDARHPSIQHWEGAFDATGSGGSMY